MKSLTIAATLGLAAGILGTTAYAANSTAFPNTNPNQTRVNLPTGQLDRGNMFADWRGGRVDRIRGGGRGARSGGRGHPPRAGRGGGGPRAGHGGGRRADWRGRGHHRGERRYYRDRYHDNWGWVVPAAAITAATIAASNNRGGGNNAYPCQARYGKYYYQGTYRPGGPCYINVRGRVIGVSNYRPN